jgi:hypothetical protein
MCVHCMRVSCVQGREAEARRVVYELESARDAQEVMESVEEEVAKERAMRHVTLLDTLRSRVARAELHVGTALQALQQLAGINTVMYFTPVILQMAGFSNTRVALLLACAPAAANAAGTVVGALLHPLHWFHTLLQVLWLVRCSIPCACNTRTLRVASEPL